MKQKERFEVLQKLNLRDFRSVMQGQNDQLTSTRDIQMNLKLMVDFDQLENEVESTLRDSTDDGFEVMVDLDSAGLKCCHLQSSDVWDDSLKVYQIVRDLFCQNLDGTG